MDQKPNEAEKPILVDKIIKEIKKTGFPLELHVLDVCSTRNTGRMPNVRYMYDGILREVDLYAFFETMIIERKKKGENFQYTSTSMIIECKKSDAKPWVFFSSPIHRDSDIFYYTKYLSDSICTFALTPRASLSLVRSATKYAKIIIGTKQRLAA